MTTEELVCDRIGYKMRWMARELRWINEPTGIQEWVASITSLCELRWKINRSVRDSPRQNAKQRCDQSWMTRAKLTTSLQAGVNIEALP